MIALRRAIPDGLRQAWDRDVSARIVSRLAASPSPRKVAIYFATPDEANIDAALPALWAAGIETAAPAWDAPARSYFLAPYTPGDALETKHFGIREVANPARRIAPAEIDVWLVPGVAFARRGEKIARLGYGGGYYDRFLGEAKAGALKLGIAYPAQILDSIPAEPHDVLLDGAIVAALS